MAYSVIDISNKIIASTAVDQGELISNLKLQKLLYYVKGFFKAAYNKDIFENPIEAWQYGPVVREAYFHFNKFGNRSIELTDETEIITFPKEEEEFFKNILEEYGQFSAIKLMNMTHEEAPWKETFSRNPQGTIPNELIVEYFKTQIIE